MRVGEFNARCIPGGAKVREMAQHCVRGRDAALPTSDALDLDLDQAGPVAAGRRRLASRVVESHQAVQHALACPPGPRGIRPAGAVHIGHGARFGVRALARSAAMDEHQVVGSHTDWPSAAPPESSAGREGSDEQLPGDASRRQPLDFAALTHRQDAGAIGRVTSRPLPARLGTLDVSPEPLVDADNAQRTSDCRYAAAGHDVWLARRNAGHTSGTWGQDQAAQRGSWRSTACNRCRFGHSAQIVGADASPQAQQADSASAANWPKVIGR